MADGFDAIRKAAAKKSDTGSKVAESLKSDDQTGKSRANAGRSNAAARRLMASKGSSKSANDGDSDDKGSGY